MKRALKIGGVALVVIVIGILATGLKVSSPSKEFAAYDAEAKAFIEETVRALGASWNKQEVLKRSSIEFAKEVTDAQMDGITKICAERLGPLDTYYGADGKVGVFYSAEYGKYLQGQYIAEANFQKGKGKISVSVLKRKGKWQLLGFLVDSEVFRTAAKGS